MKNAKGQINYHLIQLGRISDLAALLKVAADNAPSPDTALNREVTDFPLKLGDAFSLIHSMMSYHLSMIHDAMD